MRARGAAISVAALALLAVGVSLWAALRSGARAAASAAPDAASVAPRGPDVRREEAKPVEPEPQRGTAANAPNARPVAPIPTGPRGALVVDVAWLGDSAPAIGIGVAVNELDDPHPNLAWRFAETDASGRARFDGLREGDVWIRVHGIRDGEATIERGGESNARIEIPRGVALRGRVVDDAGRPASNAELFLIEQDGRESPPFANAFPCGASDSMARFSVPDAPAGAVIVAWSHERAPGPRLDYLDVAREELVVSVGPRGAVLLGQVLDPNEQPVVDAPVALAFLASATTRLLHTDSEGRFTARGLAPGTCTLHVHATGFAPHRLPIELALDRRNEHILRLEPGASVTGIVRDAKQRAIEGARVEWNDGGAFSSTVVFSLSDGSFRLPDLPGGDLQIDATHPDYAAAETSARVVPAGTTRVDFDLTAKP